MIYVFFTTCAIAALVILYAIGLPIYWKIQSWRRSRRYRRV